MPDTPYKALKIGPDGWAHGVSIGEWPIERPDIVLNPKADPSATTTITEVITAADCDAMIAHWDAAGKPELLVDSDHSADISANTKAYFWIKDMRRSDDGLEVLLDPTVLGQAEVVEGKVYRYLSPVFPWEGFVYADPATKRIGHPQVLTNFGLTNLPRMSNNRPVVHATVPPAAVAAHTTTNPKKGTTMDAKTMLCRLLGLDPETAQEEDIQAAYTAAVNANTEAEAKEALNDAGIPEDDEDTRNQLVAIFTDNKEAGLNAIKATAAALNTAAAKHKAAATKPPAATQRALNTEQRRQPGTTFSASGKFAEKQKALHSVMQANPGIARSRAYSIARQQYPEIFA